MKVKIFETNVVEPERTEWPVDQIERNFTNSKVNFDLEDCDRILRVVFDGKNQSDLLIDLLKDIGCVAEVLPDKIQTI